MDKFNPIEWASKNQPNTEKPIKAEIVNRGEHPAAINQSDLMDDIRRVVKKLIDRNIDITYDYNDWLRLGFALAEALGEQGRKFFHDLSRLCPKYDEEECDKQYNKCLNSKGNGITVRTFFQMAKEAGVDISANSANMPHGIKNEKDKEKGNLTSSDQNMPNGKVAEVAEKGNECIRNVYYDVTFSDKIIREDLPDILKQIYDSQEGFVDKDKVLLGGITNIAGAIPQSVYGIYDGRKVFASVYLVIYGPYASSKGDLEAVKKLLASIKREMRIDFEEKMKEYENQMAIWEATPKKERGLEPKMPEFTSPFISANSSSSAFYRALDANGGWGIMFETEADTLTNMLTKSDYGDYTDLLRKCFHHETLAMVRVADKINIEIEQPRLSVLLTCTGSQLALLLPPGNVANGLASRFLFYSLPEAKVEFRNVFAKTEEPVEELFKRIGEELMPLYHELKERESNPLQFTLTTDQQTRFLKHFDAVVKEQFAMLGNGIQGFIFRIALECFRYAMVLSLLRCLSNWDKQDTIFLEMQRAIVCDDRDFNTAMTIIDCLVNHTARVYSVLASEDKDPFRNCIQKPSAQEAEYYKALPEGREFRTNEAMDIAKGLSIPERTANRFLGNFINKYLVMKRVGHGIYEKLPYKESE